MKNSLFVALLFLSSLLFAEGGNTIGIKMSPLVGYRSLKYSNPPSSGRDDREKPDFGYRVGAEFRLALGERLGLYTGLNYTNSGYRVKEDLTVADENNQYQGQGTLKFNYRYKSLEVPLIFGYQLNEGEITVSPMLGVKGSYLLKAITHYQIETEHGDFNNEDKKDLSELYNPFNLWGHVAIDLAYNHDKYVLSFRPFYERMLTNVLKSNSIIDVKEYQYNYGAELVFALKL